MVMNPGGNLPSSTHELLVKTSTLDRSPLISAKSTIHHDYDIEQKQKTSSAFLYFVRDKNTNEKVVIKILRRYHDTRYSLETPEERQQYQLEALHWNQMFAPGVYIGLGRIRDRGIHQRTIILSAIIANPTKKLLDPKAEYALVMHALPYERRLDYLLKEENEIILQHHMLLLAEYVAYMHEKLTGPPVINKDSLQWGSFEQLQKKLQDNLALLDLVVTTSENGHYSSSKLRRNSLSLLLPQGYRRSLKESNRSWQDDRNLPGQLRNILNRLKKNLLQAFMQNPYQQYFIHRIQEQRIKHCHGDLKSPHIWIAPDNSCNAKEPWKYVCVLDAIDFNGSFCNIDVLSDLAMLIIDIQARTKSFELAKLMENHYLICTGQQDNVSRSVLNYYLVEKAIMWAAVSIIYDNLPELGLTFLEIAEQRMNDLMEGDLKWRADTLIGIPSISSLFVNHSK